MALKTKEIQTNVVSNTIAERVFLKCSLMDISWLYFKTVIINRNRTYLTHCEHGYSKISAIQLLS